ncbi:MAG: thiamine pyrophosphate-dependent enzyme [Prolixibacteraceae bacterium]|jgi:pyruvate/2-oxoglutarate/acetoin dehydrogenase E1 component/TPP-dependent pyruvate/acetoin dehydrogenase alpha subunit|nr:thiamine pyrophosphate-dependent enzyme [Prolixibacteraceae bacterium]
MGSKFSVSQSVFTKESVLKDYYTVFLSRQLSLLGRKEVHLGKAPFGIFGDGKELAQIAYVKSYRDGDWRSGYYRDQTFMLAAGMMTPTEFFSQLYGDTNTVNNPSTGGRNFNNHHSTANITASGELRNLALIKNSAADLSPTAGQIPRLLGLAQASKLVRDHPEFAPFTAGKITGDEVAFGSIGESSTSEGMFFETINAACVLQVPLAVAIWDNGYGISVPVDLQTAKGSISKALRGFEADGDDLGCKIYSCKGWDYPCMVQTFAEGIDVCRTKHQPVIFHIDELTQPLGHSTSGSHERYKSAERLQWEQDFDAIAKFKEWIMLEGYGDTDTLAQLEAEALKEARAARDLAWTNYIAGLESESTSLKAVVDSISNSFAPLSTKSAELKALMKAAYPTRKALIRFAKSLQRTVIGNSSLKEQNLQLASWIKTSDGIGERLFSIPRLDESASYPIGDPVKIEYSNDPPWVTGSELLNRNFDLLLQKYPLMLSFGEDTGVLGGVNQETKGLSEKFGLHRVFDTGIRETTIIGQGIGLALRGFKPIAEIQYLDYLIYALPTLADDLSTLNYRTCGRQIAPLIIRTRGHQLQGMWHSGSPMSMLLGSMRGIHLCVPRNMTQAAGFYNTLLKGDEPALVVEPLKGYYVREKLPGNIGEYCIPLGIPEILLEGTDLTLVTYGWNVTIAMEASAILKTMGISVELIDVQTLAPFDTGHLITQSVIKTNRLVLLDEDVPGGGTGYMLQKILEQKEAFYALDDQPLVISARDHRGAYGTDGEYFSKPNVDTVLEAVLEWTGHVGS